MKTEVIVAMVSGIVASAGGILSWIQATKTARLKGEADSTIELIRSEASIALESIKAENGIALENIKAENERRRKAFEIASEESKPVQAALDQAWHDVQTIKEIISKLLSAARYDVDLALEVLTPAKSNLIEGYAKWGTALSNDARNAWHRAKNSADTVELTISTLQPASEPQPELPPQLVDQLREIRLSLTDNQMIIAASRQMLRDQEARKILEVL